jgi:uncharacterized protein (DUF849 family)
VEKLIITATITSLVTVRSLEPYLPLPPKQITDSAIAAAEAVARIVHIHVRRPEDGYPFSDPKHFRDIITRIKEKSDGVIWITKSGRALMSVTEPTTSVALFKPEVFSFKTGPVDFALHTGLYSVKEFKYPWENECLKKVRISCSRTHSKIINTFAR